VTIVLGFIIKDPTAICIISLLGMLKVEGWTSNSLALIGAVIFTVAGIGFGG